ncbi:MAG: hypothetical protein JSV66_03560 [Trueperaceae bacterium]|nr:MAG: hypothetical protein JSV66_03560 [Trueperaceae bacterium]
MKRLVFLIAFGLLFTGCNTSGPSVDGTPLELAGHDDDPRTNNNHPMGHHDDPASLLNPTIGNPNISTDIAFWGKYAFQGTWLGFRILNIAAPGNPKEISETTCTGNQGDMVVWEDVLVRSWNSPAGTSATCDGQPVPAGFEGLHIFDISDLNDPVLVGSVATPCGSHTATGVPDPDNNRLLIYNNGSSGACLGIDIVEVPLDDPASASILRFENTGPAEIGTRDCHDTSVILGDAMLAACAGDDGYTMWTLTGSGSLEDPDFLYDVTVPGVSIGHSGSFTYDGAVYVFGHEPGGGVAPRCQEPNPDSDKSFFFFDTSDGTLLGTWVLPRPQSALENCTLHNFNTVPLRNGNYVLVHGSYQSGTSVVDFTDPANAFEVAYSDPPALDPFDLGGAWSTYWYNNFMYETNITEGLNIFRLSDKATAGAMRLPHLNPQTQEFTID